MNEEQAIKSAVVLTAEFFGVRLSDAVVQMHFEDLADLPASDVLAAFKAYRRDPKNTRAPLPAQIRAMINPESSPVDAARVAEAEIWGAIARFGYARPFDAEQSLGELAWEGVKRSGGWASVCIASGDNPTAYRAQMRELLAALHRRSLAGTLSSKVPLPNSERSLKQLGGKNG